MALLVTASLTSVVNGQNYSDQYRNSPKEGVVTSGKVPNLEVYDDSGKALKLQKLCNGQYTLLVMGCLTCPEFRQMHPSIEAINADYAALGVQTYFVFKSLRHPELDGYVEPQNISERLLMVEEIKELLGGKITWLVDGIENQMALELRSGSRSAYLVSPQGEIIQGWAAPAEQPIRRALTQAVGEPAKVTSADQLNLPTYQRAQRRTNIDSDTSIQRGDGLVIVETTPHNPEETFYVKMRAEADTTLLESGTGRLALGFFPDPIHDAHWNNLATPMKYTITLPEGVTASPQEASAKRGKGDSDTEPRQFWVDIAGASPNDKIEVTYHYYGCAPGMCEMFTHTYTIELTPESHGASTFGFNKGQRGNQSGQNSQNRNRANASTNATRQTRTHNR